MQRHRTDFVALFFGLAFLAGGAGFIVHQTTGRDFDQTWIAAVALVSIGCIFLGATLLRGPRPAPTPVPVTNVSGEPADTAVAAAPTGVPAESATDEPNP